MSNNPESNETAAATRHSTPASGSVGEFTDARGNVCQCVVIGEGNCPFDDDILVIDYVTAEGHHVAGAMIPKTIFRPDPFPPNAKMSREYGATAEYSLTPAPGSQADFPATAAPKKRRRHLYKTLDPD